MRSSRKHSNGGREHLINADERVTDLPPFTPRMPDQHYTRHAPWTDPGQRNSSRGANAIELTSMRHERLHEEPHYETTPPRETEYNTLQEFTDDDTLVAELATLGDGITEETQWNTSDKLLTHAITIAFLSLPTAYYYFIAGELFGLKVERFIDQDYPNSETMEWFAQTAPLDFEWTSAIVNYFQAHMVGFNYLHRIISDSANRRFYYFKKSNYTGGNLPTILLEILREFCSVGFSIPVVITAINLIDNPYTPTSSAILRFYTINGMLLSRSATNFFAFLRAIRQIVKFISKHPRTRLRIGWDNENANTLRHYKAALLHALNKKYNLDLAPEEIDLLSQGKMRIEGDKSFHVKNIVAGLISFLGAQYAQAYFLETGQKFTNSSHDLTRAQENAYWSAAFALSLPSFLLGFISTFFITRKIMGLSAPRILMTDNTPACIKYPLEIINTLFSGLFGTFSTGSILIVFWHLLGFSITQSIALGFLGTFMVNTNFIYGGVDSMMQIVLDLVFFNPGTEEGKILLYRRKAEAVAQINDIAEIEQTAEKSGIEMDSLKRLVPLIRNVELDLGKPDSMLRPTLGRGRANTTPLAESSFLNSPQSSATSQRRSGPSSVGSDRSYTPPSTP
jgi:hypothetical protein